MAYGIIDDNILTTLADAVRSKERNKTSKLSLTGTSNNRNCIQSYICRIPDTIDYSALLLSTKIINIGAYDSAYEKSFRVYYYTLLGNQTNQMNQCVLKTPLITISSASTQTVDLSYAPILGTRFYIEPPSGYELYNCQLYSGFSNVAGSSAVLYGCFTGTRPTIYVGVKDKY